jgi:hypothetical protein
MGCDAVWLLLEPMFRRNALPPASGWKESASNCLLLVTKLPACRFLSLWWWRRYIPPKRWFLQEPHGVTTQKTPFFMDLFNTCDRHILPICSTTRLPWIGGCLGPRLTLGGKEYIKIPWLCWEPNPAFQLVAIQTELSLLLLSGRETWHLTQVP